MPQNIWRNVAATLIVVSLSFICATPSYAVNATSFLSGTVTNNGVPAANITVTASGNDLTISAKTDAKGHFSFPPLPVGTYVVSAESSGLRGSARVDLGSGGAIVAIALQSLKQIGHVIVNAAQAEVAHGSGSDVVLNSTALTQMPFNNSFSEMEIQMPGAVRGANGVVHMNGDHGVINYMVDGVPLPQELNRDIGGEINLNNLSLVDLIEGAYPAQYGLKFGSVFNMATKAGTGPAGFDGYLSGGSYTNAQGQIGYHTPIAGGGGFDIAFSGYQTTRGLDPPNFSSPHNDASSLGQFMRFTLPAGKNDFTSITVVNSHSTFQIPNDVDGGEPANTDDNETQADTFISAQFHHAIGDTGEFTFGPAYKVSRIQDFGDPTNDFIYGENVNLASGGSATDCATALANPARVWAHDLRHIHLPIRGLRSTTSCRPTTINASGGIRSQPALLTIFASPEKLCGHASAG